MIRFRSSIGAEFRGNYNTIILYVRITLIQLTIPTEIQQRVAGSASVILNVYRVQIIYSGLLLIQCMIDSNHDYLVLHYSIIITHLSLKLKNNVKCKIKIRENLKSCCGNSIYVTQVLTGSFEDDDNK